MKRGGVGARDSPTKDRYAGKRQQQVGRGGRRQKPGSRGIATVIFRLTFSTFSDECRCVTRSTCLAGHAELQYSHGSSPSGALPPPAGHAAATPDRDCRQDPAQRPHCPDTETHFPNLL